MIAFQPRVHLIALLVTIVAAGVAAAQDQTSTRVSGGERVEWQQYAASDDDFGALAFLIYVDGIPSPALDVHCRPRLTVFVCTAPVPQLARGEHVIEMTARYSNGRESDRSSPLRVLMSPPGTSADTPVSWVSADGVRLTAQTLTSGIQDAVDIAVLGDGRIAIAERSGRIRVFNGSSLTTAFELVPTYAEPGTRVLSIARTGEANNSESLHFISAHQGVARLGRLGVGAANVPFGPFVTLLDGLPAGAEPRAALRLRDGLLFLALDDGGQPERSGDRGAANGKVLRLTAEGLIPTGALTPIYAIGTNAPLAMSWSVDRGMLSLFGGSSVSDARYLTLLGDGGRLINRVPLPFDEQVTGTSPYYNASAQPQRSWLIATPTSIFQLSAEANGSVQFSSFAEHNSQLTEISAMASDPSGAIYLVCGDRLVRIAVQP